MVRRSAAGLARVLVRRRAMTGLALELRDYQVEALERVEQAEARGVRRQLGVAATGLGKTVMFCALAQRRGGRALILAHRDELIAQAAAKVREVWPGVDVGIVKGSTDEVHSHVVVASVQTLARQARLDRLTRPFGPDAGLLGRADPFDLVIVDECFPAGTLVGGRPIETLRPGDLVPSWDEVTGRPCERPVVEVQRRTPNALVTVSFNDGTTVTCTPNHPVMTAGGWCPAGLLQRDVDALSFTHHADADRDHVHRVRLTRDDHRQGPARLLPALRSGVLLRRVSRLLGRSGPFAAHGPHEPGARVGADEGPQPDGVRRVAVENGGDAPGDGSSPSCPGWERGWPDRAAEGVERPARLAGRGHRADGPAGEGRATVALQDRRGEPGGEGGGRDRWGIPCLAGPPRVRPAEGRVATWRRVVRVEVHEPGSNGRYGNRCRDGAVYNLEVAGTHTYLVGDGLVVHNCHHAAADSYGRILAALDAGEPGGPLLFGVTATPDRGDGKGLDDLFDEIVFSYDILWGIRSGYLSDLRGLAVRISTLDLSDVKVSRGDYAAGDAGRALEASGAPAKIVEAWLAHAAGRRTIVFTPTVANAEHIAAEFAAAGISAATVSGETPPDRRRETLRRFSSGEIQVVANCAVLTEGYDNPAVDCVVVARPTRSRALYVQMVGRGTRRHPSKADCLIVDVVGATDEHSLVTVPSLFGLEGAHRNRMGNGAGALSAVVEEHQQELLAAGRITAAEADLFRRVRAEGIAWVQVHRPGDPLRRYQRSLGGRNHPTVVLVQKTPEPDSWLAGYQLPDGQKRVLIHGVSLEMAQGVAEDFVRRKTPGGLALVTADAAWRQRPPSPKALAAAKRWRLRVERGWTAGELSDALDAHIARCKAKRPPSPQPVE